MGNYKLLYRREREQYESRSDRLRADLRDLPISNLQRVFEGKVALIVVVLTYILGWASNLDNVKSTILFIVGLLMALIKFYFTIRGIRQKQKLRDLDIKEREQDLYHFHEPRSKQ